MAGTTKDRISALDRERIAIAPYDANWPLLYTEIEKQIKQMVPRQLMQRISHIGSTAVPGLPAKPVIDIMAPVLSLDASRDAIEAVAAAGYVYFPYKPDAMHWFCKLTPAHRTHHLHLVPIGSALWQQRLAFRNALRGDPALAAEYAELKARLAAQFALDREAYTEGKTPFITRVLASPQG